MSRIDFSDVIKLGHHLLVEFYDCDKAVLNDPSTIEECMVSAAIECGATVVQKNFHLFSPYGVSGVVVLAESHLAIHTWPEYDYAAVDLFTCGERCNPLVAFHWLKKALKAKTSYYTELNRGLLEKKTKSLVKAPPLVLSHPTQIEDADPIAEAAGGDR